MVEDRWVSVVVAAELRGVSKATVRNAALDERVEWRWGFYETSTRFGLAQRRRMEVYMPSVYGCKFAGVGNSVYAAPTGPVTDETWARFEEVYAQLARGEVWPATQGEHDGSTGSPG